MFSFTVYNSCLYLPGILSSAHEYFYDLRAFFDIDNFVACAGAVSFKVDGGMGIGGFYVEHFARLHFIECDLCLEDG